MVSTTLEDPCLFPDGANVLPVSLSLPSVTLPQEGSRLVGRPSSALALKEASPLPVSAG